MTETSSAGDVSFSMGERVARELLSEARRRSAVHLGVLLGRADTVDGGHRVELTGVAELTYTARLETSYRPVRSAVDAVRDAVSADERDVPGRMAGLAAMVEDSGGELLPGVVRLHLSLFNAPNQVALVGDPETAEFGLYVRSRDGSFESVPFEIGVDLQVRSERREDENSEGRRIGANRSDSSAGNPG